MPNIRMVIKTGFLGAEHDKEIHVPDEDWDTWDPEDRNQHMQDELAAYLADEIDSDWGYVDKEDADKYGDRHHADDMDDE